MCVEKYDLNVPVFTDDENIYILAIEFNDDGGVWLMINSDTGYDLRKWTIADAIADYLTPEAKAMRTEAEYRAWGYYD